MRKFLSQVSLYIFIVLLACYIYIAGCIYVLRSKCLYIIPLSKTTLVLGDSHTADGINDSLIDHSFNLSENADPYMVSYGKLKIMTSANPQINRVFVSCTKHNFSKETADKWIYSDKQLAWKFGTTFFLVNPSDILYLFTHNLKSSLKLFASIARDKTELCMKIIMHKINLADLHLGGYGNLTHVLNTKNDTESNTNEKDQISEIQIKYLHKIEDYCNKNKIELILINTPVNRLSVEYNENEGFLDLLKTQFPKIKFLDYSKYQLPDSCYADLSHLNHLGAENFSNFLNNKLSQDATMPN